jgi:hypothetical protein
LDRVDSVCIGQNRKPLMTLSIRIRGFISESVNSLSIRVDCNDADKL